MSRMEFLRARIVELLEKRKTAEAAVDEVLAAPTADNRNLTADETTRFTERQASVNAIDTEIEGVQTELTQAEEAEKRSTAAAALSVKYGQVQPDGPEKRKASGVQVVREPLTYEPDSPHSYFLDLARAQFRSDAAATERLHRHGQEMDVELPARAQRRRDQADREMRGLDHDILTPRQRRAGLASGFERRVSPNRTDGQGGYFVPPLWMVDGFVDLPRFGRPFANRVRGMTLPGGTDSINVPKVNTGTLTGMQTADGQAVTSQDLTDTFINAPVRTIAGQQDVAMQLLDQSPISFDEIIFTDLIQDLNMQIDLQTIIGTGLNGQMLGVMNVSGTNTVAALTTDPAKLTDATTPANGVYPNFAAGLSQIAKNRKLPADSIVVSPSFWYWALSQQDANGRPLIVPMQAAQNPAALTNMEPVVEGPAGVMLGHAVVLDGNIPTNLGGSTNEQRPFAVRADDMFLWEGSMQTRVLQEVLSGTLQVRFQIWEYAAFMPHRRPTSISIFNGASYKVQTGF